MERITGKQAQDMMEALASVYEKNVEPTETEQVDEGVMKALKKVTKAIIGPANQSPEAEAARTNKRRPQTKQEKGVAAGTVNKNESVEVDVDSIEEEKTTNSPMHRPGGKLSPLTSDKKPKSKKSPSPTKMGKPSNPPMKEDLDLFDTIKNYLIDEGLSEEEALKKMLTLTDEERTEIIEQYRVGFRPDGRYQNADGSHTGPIMGAIKSILSGNLPKSRTVIPPTPQPSVTVTQTRNPTKKTPYSKGEDGKLTDFGAGGGDTKMSRTGMSVAEVEALGRKNKAAKGPKPYEQGGPRLPGRDM